MTYIEKQLDSISRYITITGQHCYFCSKTGDLHSHHLFRGRWKSIWYFRWMPEFQIPLCGNCHLFLPYAPHKNMKSFWGKFESLMILRDPERLKLINHYRNTKIGLPEKPNLKELLKDLQLQAAKIENESWMDLEVCDNIYKGRNDDNEIYHSI